MLINLSNHPYDTWSSRQQQAAIQHYGTVRDIPFPHIPPDATHREVMDIIRMYWTLVNEQLQGLEQAAVHVMGELVFCHAFVNLCYDHSVTCVASTTRRVVEQVGDRKISRFDFVQFRPYLRHEL